MPKNKLGRGGVRGGRESTFHKLIRLDPRALHYSTCLTWSETEIILTLVPSRLMSGFRTLVGSEFLIINFKQKRDSLRIKDSVEY